MSDTILNEKEKNIIEAARKRFAHYGFSKVTMDEIAADVDMGKASLYYYFPTKESIFKLVIRQEQEELAGEIESIIEKKITCSKKLVEYVEVRLKHFQKLVNLGTLSAHSFNDSKSVYKKLFMEFETKELTFLESIINEGVESGEFKNDLDKNTASVLLHILQGLRFRILKQHRDIELDENVIKGLQNEMNSAIKIIINGIIK